MTQLGLYRRDPDSQNWVAIPTDRDDSARTASAEVSQAGDYALLAPLVCPADMDEPFDDAPSWKTVLYGFGLDTTLDRMFDIPGDEDWIAFEATAGLTYLFRTQNLAQGVDTLLTLYANDEETVLAVDDNGAGGNASRIEWTADANGLYYLRVSPVSGTPFGCNSTYQLHLGDDSLKLYLPLQSP